MQRIQNKTSLQQIIATWRDAGETVAFVPTMGNLHEGHLSLVDEAKRRADRCVVSIFVNPTQFGQGEDFEHYPRTEQQDCDALDGRSVDLVYLPDVEDIYPEGMGARPDIHVPASLGDILCGEARPGHFDGVATVVRRLFEAVQPDVAVLGDKDYQQLQVIRWLVADQAMPVKIVGVPIARDADGLAMSSRNQYLSAAEREQAPQLYAQLKQLGAAIEQGERDMTTLSAQARAQLEASGWQVDYVSILSRDLRPVTDKDRDFVVLAAARLGQTRLIDNLECSSEG